jgi:hypothetical protein
MAVRRKINKERINVLLDIDNFFGEHRGRLGPIMVFLVIAAAPVLLYAFILQLFIPIWVLLVFEVLWAGRWALFILGKENDKLKVWEAGMRDEYSNADDLVYVSHVYEDGLVEYMNGQCVYIVCGLTGTYFNDDKFSADFEDFLHEIKGFEFNIHAHMVAQEIVLQDNLDKLRVYKDKRIIKERASFYIEQDAWCDDNAQLYQYNFVIKGSKYNWKSMRKTLEDVLKSSSAEVFSKAWIATRDDVDQIMSRDICAFINLTDMLQKKFASEDYRGSKVLFYGEEVPEEFLKNEDLNPMRGRRVVVNGTEGSHGPRKRNS